MFKKLLILCLILVGLFVGGLGSVSAADIDLSWPPVDGAIGYYVFMSTDSGGSWSDPKITPLTEYTWVQAPDSGLVLWRVAAFNAQGVSLRTESGAWYNGDWQLVAQPVRLGVK
jgi:hypothetical protein